MRSAASGRADMAWFPAGPRTSESLVQPRAWQAGCILSLGCYVEGNWAFAAGRPAVTRQSTYTWVSAADGVGLTGPLPK